MGLDFIRRAAPTFKKSWSQGASELAIPTLFTIYPECRSRSVIAALENDAKVELGVSLEVHVLGSSLTLVRETICIGTVATPPNDLFTAIQGAGGCAIGKISKFNPLSGTANVEID